MDRPDGSKMRIGFRPFAVQISSDTAAYRCRAVLRHTFFLGVMLRLELELPSGLTIRSRMTKEEYSALGLKDGQEVSFIIKRYRILRGDLIRRQKRWRCGNGPGDFILPAVQ